MKPVVLFLLLLIFPLTHAATLRGVNGVEILAVDGQKISANVLNNKPTEHPEGNHQIVVKYKKNVNNKGLVQSKPHIFNVDIIGDTAISVRNFNDTLQAENQIKQGITWIVTNSKETRNIIGSDSLSGTGFMPYRDIEKLIKDYNQSNGIYLTSAEGHMINNEPGQDKTQQLIKLYQSASKEQRKNFRIWLLEQDIK